MLNVMASCDLEGNGVTQILSASDPIKHPFGLDVLGDNIYWTNWNTQSVYQVNKNTGGDIKLVTDKTSDKPMGIRVFHSSRQPMAAPVCGGNNGGCSHVCLPSPSGAVTCACPSGMALDADNKNCVISSQPTQSPLPILPSEYQCSKG